MQINHPANQQKKQNLNLDANVGSKIMAVDKKRIEGENTDIKNSIWTLIPSLIMLLLGFCVWFCRYDSLIMLGVYIGLAMVIAGAFYLKTYFLWNFGWNLAIGLTNIFVGIILVTNMSVNLATFHVIIGLWALSIGVIQIGSADRMRNVSNRWSGSLASGLLSVLFGYLMVGSPYLGNLTMTTLLGIYLVAYSVMEIIDWSIKRDVNVKI